MSLLLHAITKWQHVNHEKNGEAGREKIKIKFLCCCRDFIPERNQELVADA
jgi:hypothetical protein